ncbi:hypothetical protein D9758_003975 [Tetrapyrgos nigripes]|uniref:Uncharacterized protein n=1 Tax=Tetrapyrgos nigripes TaxID=182062 RepID=A0A8H5GLE6_9AGAR|nr:hypothetical protein D9758_003975 [Tetrapyrgos nigripes]
MQQYSHMNLAERRDSGLDSSGSTPFQSHVPSINHALDETQESFDEGGGQGAKHWSDEEKSKLFKWLMGPGQDDHWNSLRATKNSCLRECASEVFGGKKTYQALKGCYERNFNLFKQIYSFETFHNQNGTLGVNPNLSEADSLREYERRLHTARKAGCDVGNITARTIDNWHRNGWYELFYRRWHGDPATTRPTVNHRGVPTSANGGGEAEEGAELDEALREMNIIPADSNALEPIFESLSYCASLHPDPPSSEYDDDDEEDQFADADGANGFETFTGSEQEELSAVGRAALEHLESIIVYPEGVKRPEGHDDGEDDAEKEKSEEKKDETKTT